MKSKTSLPSSKSIHHPTQNLIALKCSQDHFSYQKQLPPKKNISSYLSAYHSVDHTQQLENHKLEQLRKIIAPAYLNHDLLRRSLHQSRQFSPQKPSNLPSLKSGSTYKASYLQKINDSVDRGKQQQGFFIKMPWHENPSTNYRKSYGSTHVEHHLQKGKPIEDHIKLFKTPFKAQSIYGQQFSQLRLNQAQISSKDCIKNKDHLAGVNCSLKGQSQYKSKYEKNKENLPSQKSIKSKKHLSMLPEIKRPKKLGQESELPKKSLKMKNVQTSPANMENLPIKDQQL